MTDVLINLGWLSLGLALLYYGAEWLVQGASKLSLKIGLMPLVVGLTVVAFGTSAPELLVSLQANSESPPRGGFALGNVIGSNVCNLALILGFAALIRPIKVHAQILKKDVPILIVVTLIFVWMLRDQQISSLEGALLTVSLIAYISISIWLGLKTPQSDEVEGLGADEIKEAKQASVWKVVSYFLLIVLGLFTLAFGANRLILGGVGIATLFNVPDVIIALSLVALGTSLPELATSIVASAKGQGDIIIGNVVGSNLFNMLAVAGITGLVAPIVGHDLKSFDLWFMIGLTIICLPFMWTGKQIGRREGALLLSLYAGYIAFMFFGSSL